MPSAFPPRSLVHPAHCPRRRKRESCPSSGSSKSQSRQPPPYLPVLHVIQSIKSNDRFPVQTRREELRMVLAEVNNLVDLDRGLISPRIFSEDSIYQRGAGANIRPLLALPLPRDPDPQPRRLLHHLHGRGPRAGHPRPAGQGQRLPEHLPPPGQPPLPRRGRQRRHLHLRLPRLGLRRRRQAGRPSPTCRTPTTTSWTSPSGASSRWPSWTPTRA